MKGEGGTFLERWDEVKAEALEQVDEGRKREGLHMALIEALQRGALIELLVRADEDRVDLDAARKALAEILAAVNILVKRGEIDIPFEDADV